MLKDELKKANDKLVSMVKMLNHHETSKDKRSAYWYDVHRTLGKEFKSHSFDNFGNVLKDLEIEFDNCRIDFKMTHEKRDEQGNWFVYDVDDVKTIYGSYCPVCEKLVKVRLYNGGAFFDCCDFSVGIWGNKLIK